MAQATVFESTNLAAVKFAKRIFDVVVEDKDIENGTFGHLGEQVEEGSHIYKFVPGVVEGEPVLVANQPAWTEDDSRLTSQRRDKFVISAGTPFRAFELQVNDEFAISIEGVSADTQSAMQVGAFATVDSDGKLKAAAASDDDASFEVRVERQRVVGGTLSTAAHNYGSSSVLYTCKVQKLV